MKKLTLRMDDLAVESFSTERILEQRGTVHGNTDAPWKCSYPISCDYGCNTRDAGTCPTGPTCEASCNGSCDASCQASGCGTCDGQVGCGPTWYAFTCPPECHD